MPCIVCKSPESPYNCTDCADAVCRDHAVACSACRKALCPQHIQQTPGGRILCATCMAARNERHRQRRQEAAAAAPPAPEAPKAESFSFQDLISDLQPVPSAPGGGTGFQDLAADMQFAPPRDLHDPRDDRNAGQHGLDDVPDPEVERKLRQMLGEDETAVRVLTGASPKSRPMWISGTFLGVLTWGVCYFIALNSAYNSVEPYISYIVAVLALGTGAWGVSGLRNENDTESERKLSWIPLVLAISAGAIALFQSGSK